MYNQILSRTRVVIEHAHSGMKRLRVLKDECRLHQAEVRDRLRVVGCGLHNLRVAGVDAKRLYQVSSRPQAYIST